MKVAQSSPTCCDPMDYTVHGILRARILEWVAWVFPTQGSNSGLSHCRQILYHMSHQGSPIHILVRVKQKTWAIKTGGEKQKPCHQAAHSSPNSALVKCATFAWFLCLSPLLPNREAKRTYPRDCVEITHYKSSEKVGHCYYGCAVLF